jgi:hypothetical protein
MAVQAIWLIGTFGAYKRGIMKNFFFKGWRSGELIIPVHPFAWPISALFAPIPLAPLLFHCMHGYDH